MNVTGMRVPLFSETPLTLLVGAQRPQEVDAAKGRPIHVGEVEFAEHALPQQESGKPYLPAGPDDEVGVGKIRSIEGSADRIRSHEVDDLLQSLVLRKLISKEGADRIHNLSPSAIGRRNRKVHSAVLFRCSLRGAERRKSRRGEKLQPSDRAHPDLPAMEFAVAGEMLELSLHGGQNPAHF